MYCLLDVLSVVCIIIQLFFLVDTYKIVDEVLGRGANTVVKGCVNCLTNQEYAVKVSWNNKIKNSLSVIAVW